MASLHEDSSAALDPAEHEQRVECDGCGECVWETEAEQRCGFWFCAACAEVDACAACAEDGDDAH